MVFDRSIGHVAAKNMSKLILIRARDVRVRRLVLEFYAVELGASHDALLLTDLQRLPFNDPVLLLLQQQN
jgi:hypothetical protein